MKNSLYLGLIISTLGYFVDIYDLALFSIVRTQSLIDLGFSGEALQQEGIFILNMPMLGMLIGDKRGRISVLFCSILLYSIANIANGYVQDSTTYAWVRFFAGISLAGEMGVSITLMSESLPQKYRGYGTLLITAAGAIGSIVAFYVADLTNWRTAYFVGGGMGLVLLLLLLRFRLIDSPLFIKMHKASHRRGNFFMLFKEKNLFSRYLKCICLGLPLWGIVGIVATFSPEIALGMGVTDPISAGRCIMLSNVGLALGDIGSCLLSQFLKSRRKALAFFIAFTTIALILLLSGNNYTAETYYWGIFFLGFGAGMWALAITTTAEQFGTDIRATVTTSVPNFVRAMVIPLTIIFQLLQDYFSIQYAALITTSLTLLLALIALLSLAENFYRNLDFYEKKSL